jgi:hypothetical protein
MKKKVLIVLSALLVFGLVAVTFAYNRANNTSQSSEASSCPMHKQTASTDATQNDSCCGMADCCKDGKCSMDGACCKDKDSCPMKQKGESKTASDMDMSKVTVVGGEESCCQKGADCCKGGGACCKHKS